jgi:hypothetical protein
MDLLKAHGPLQLDNGLPSRVGPLGTSELLEAAELLQDFLRGFPLSLNLLLARLPPARPQSEAAQPLHAPGVPASKEAPSQPSSNRPGGQVIYRNLGPPPTKILAFS